MGLKINVEIPILLVFFAFNFSGTISGNYIIYTTCYVTLGYNESLCALLGTNNTNNETAALEAEVQPYANKVTVTSSVIDATFAPMLCFFLGPWTDKFGRRSVMLVAIIGFALSDLIRCIITAIPNVSPWFMLFKSIPTSLTGGFAAAVTTMLCFITDTTSEEERGIKMYLIEGILGLATVISSLTAPLAFHTLGYPAVFFISFLSGVLAWIYIFLFIPESVRDPQRENKWRSLFDFKLLKSTLETLFKPRDHYRRAIILTTFALLASFMFCHMGHNTVLFLYLRNKFSWALEECTFYTSVMTVISIVGGTVAIALFYKLLRFREISILVLSSLVCLVAALFQGMARNNFEMYISGSINFLSNTISPMTRSLLSKVVDAEDHGKIFSILITVESLFALFGNLFYTFLYNSTIITFPAAFYFLTSGLHAFDVVLLCVIMYFQKFQNQLVYANFSEESVS